MDERGFTLIELLVVMVIIAALAALAVPQLAGAGRAGDRAKASTAARAALDAAQAQAYASGNPTAPVWAQTHDGPSVDAVAEDGRSPLLFYRDESSSGGTIRIKGQPALAVDWLTGETADAH